MGGRGAFSASHGGMRLSSGGAGSLYISSKVETRKDIRQLFINELGFKELYGTNSIDTAQLSAIGIQLKKLKSEYPTLEKSQVYLSVTREPDAKGAAAQMRDGSMIMLLNPNYHNGVSKSRATLRGEQKEGFKTKTDNKITNDFSYTARHEYGHLTQFTITRETGKNASTIRSEVQSIAKSHGAKSAIPSKYGGTNEYEYFAESFASMTGGKPNAHGRALSEWMKKNRRAK